MERTREGLVAERKRGRVGGRPPPLLAEQKELVRKRRDDEGQALAKIARQFNVSTRTVRRV